MDKYLTITDFPNQTGVMPIVSSVVTAVPVFFPMILFSVWMLGTGASYFTILKTTGKKRFWSSITSMSFVTFLFSLIIVGMNTATITYLSGYWVGFYILMTLISWFMLSNYK